MSLTLILIIITVLISYSCFNNLELRSKLMFTPYIIDRDKQYYRFITSGFIHADFLHLLFNMFVLWMFGGYVEQIFVAIYGTVGYGIYLALYILGIIISDIPSFIRHKDEPHYNALGASGGVSSILFSFIMFDPLQDLCLYGLICLPGFIWGVLYIVYSVYMSKQKRDNVNHDAHLWGGIFGIVFTTIVVPGVISSFLEQLKDFSVF